MSTGNHFATTALPPQQNEELPKFLSERECLQIAKQAQAASGGRPFVLSILSTWTGSVRWGRNHITLNGGTQNNLIRVARSLTNADTPIFVSNDVTEGGVAALMRRSDQLESLAPEQPLADMIATAAPEQMQMPSMFSDATYQLDATARTAVARRMIQPVAAAGMLSAGYIEVAAQSLCVFDSAEHMAYLPVTQAQCSVTVRDPNGTGSGWAGIDWHDWGKIEPDALAQTALHKCLDSRNPARLEPGRYTAILEPQATADFVGPLFNMPLWSGRGWYYGAFDREHAEFELGRSPSPFQGKPLGGDQGPSGISRLGERLIDERITIRSDPCDPEMPSPPFPLWGNPVATMPVYHGVTWIKNGVLHDLSYDRNYGVQRLGRDAGFIMSGAFHMSGGTTSIDEMIASTERGILVTRFDRIRAHDLQSTLIGGCTRDGLWLVERGKISKPLVNMFFRQPIVAALNSVSALGVPRRTFHPAPAGNMLLCVPQSAIAPAITISDFNFTALLDAV